MTSLETYQELVKSASSVLIEFYASWCPHCQKMMPVVNQVKELLNGRAEVYQFDIDKNVQLAARLDVQSIPTFIVYRNGEEVWRHTGEVDGELLISKVQS